jgi:hypothetical protein
MCGAIPPLPQYVFMAWCSVKAKGTTLPLHLDKRILLVIYPMCLGYRPQVKHLYFVYYCVYYIFIIRIIIYMYYVLYIIYVYYVLYNLLTEQYTFPA